MNGAGIVTNGAGNGTGNETDNGTGAKAIFWAQCETHMPQIPTGQAAEQQQGNRGSRYMEAACGGSNGCGGCGGCKCNGCGCDARGVKDVLVLAAVRYWQFGKAAL